MKKIKLISVAVISAVLLISCDSIFNFDKNQNFLKPLPEDSFYAQNISTGSYYIVKANHLYSGTQCEVWAENGSGVTLARAKEIAEKYDTIIRPRIVGEFSKKNFYVNSLNKTEYKEGSPTDQKLYFDDILDYANWLAGRDDGKLTILLLDIRDGYTPGGSYVAGYFFNGNFNPQGKIPGYNHYSNGRDMIYIDTYPGLQTSNIEVTYATFAHELQHLINYATTRLLDRRYSDTWIDEGLSAWAEYLYFGDNPVDKYRYFIEDRAGTIARGNNFFVWGNHTNENPDSILDEYSTVYLFFRWLYLQAAEKGLHNEFFYKIITSQYYDYRAVTGTAEQINGEWGTWENLLRTWLAANFYPQNPHYGYKGDNDLMHALMNNTEERLLLSQSSIQLYPGEGVYSRISGSFSLPAGSGENIRYAGLTNTSAINTVPSYTGNTLLTFNSSNNLAKNQEKGYLTGNGFNISRTLTGGAQTVEINRPFVLDARDVLGRNRSKDLPVFRPEQ